MAVTNGECRDRVMLDEWHPIWAIDEAKPNVVYVTRLLGESVSFAVTAEGRAAVWRTRSDLVAGMPVDPESIADALPSRCELQPYSILLYKSCPAAPERMDLIGLFVQSLTEEQVRAHMFLSLVDDESSIALIRFFVQTILAQDMPILENQNPKLLPLDPRAETPIRSDRASITYRRWLSDLGVTYGVIPAA